MPAGFLALFVNKASPPAPHGSRNTEVQAGMALDDGLAVGFRAMASSIGRIVRRGELSLFRVARRIIAAVLPADMLSARFVRRLFLSLLVADDALLR